MAGGVPAAPGPEVSGQASPVSCGRLSAARALGKHGLCTDAWAASGSKASWRGTKRWGPIPALAPLCRQRWGQDPALPLHMLPFHDGHLGLGPRAAGAPLTTASQRFYHILHVAASAGEHEKVVQVILLCLECFWGCWYASICLRLCPQRTGDASHGVKLKEQWDGTKGWWTLCVRELSQR